MSHTHGLPVRHGRRGAKVAPLIGDIVSALNITEITHIHHKSDMSRWTRAHADAPGINWSVYPGPGGTMIIVEHEEDRETFLAAQAAQREAAVLAAAEETVADAAKATSFLDFTASV